MRTHLKFDTRFTQPAATVLAPWSLEVIILTNPNILTNSATNVPGYSELSGLYRKYRVRSGHVRYSLANDEAFPVEMFCTPVNFLPSTVTDPSRFFSMLNSRRQIVSAKGGVDHATVLTRASIAHFGGSLNSTVEDAYVGTTDNSSPPSDNLYFIYGFVTNGLATAAANLGVVTVELELDFFELQSPAT